MQRFCIEAKFPIHEPSLGAIGFGYVRFKARWRHCIRTLRLYSELARLDHVRLVTVILVNVPGHTRFSPSKANLRISEGDRSESRGIDRKNRTHD